MKVVIFCGGLGLRLRELSENVPKPLVPIGDAPVIWHLMKYYSHYGHDDFILCLGHKSESIKRFFLNYTEALSRDFVLSNGGRNVELLGNDFSSWRMTFVDTGANAPVGERLLAVREYLDGEPMFLANYVDGLSDINLNAVIRNCADSNITACFVTVPPTQSFHFVESDENSNVKSISQADTSNTWINAGYFVFRHDIFNYLRVGEDLVDEPVQRLIAARQLKTIKHRGFWACTDTLKERQQLEDLWLRGVAPWAVWRNNGAERATSAAGI